MSSRGILVNSILFCAMLAGCVGGLIELPDGTRIRQPWNANTPAQWVDGETSITTGADLPRTQAEIREGARSKLIYIGGGLIVCGALVIGVLKYPTPGALVIGSGVLLITLHQYPWIGWVAIGLCVDRWGRCTTGTRSGSANLFQHNFPAQIRYLVGQKGRLD
jgi:hypothetical protein